MSHKKLLILDIDETLLHASEVSLGRDPDYLVGKYFVYKRPHLEKFLNFCSQNFELAIWTTATKAFAYEIVEKIFEKDTNLSFVWSEEKCTYVKDATTAEYHFLKNLIKVKNKGYSLDHVIMVDDTPEKLKKNYGNLVRVNAFLGDENDEELLKLMLYLADLKDAPNIRSIEKRGWQNKY